jgi:hypothetical protein
MHRSMQRLRRCLRSLRRVLSAGAGCQCNGALRCSGYRLRGNMPPSGRIHGARQRTGCGRVPDLRGSLRRLRRRMRETSGGTLPGMHAGMLAVRGRMPPHGYASIGTSGHQKCRYFSALIFSVAAKIPDRGSGGAGRSHRRIAPTLLHLHLNSLTRLNNMLVDYQEANG